MPKLSGSKRLGRWIASDKIDVVQKWKVGANQNGAMVLEFEETGEKFAVFPRRHKDTYRMGRPTMTAARKEHVECWFLDPEILALIRRTHAPKTLIIFETDTDDFWVSPFDWWFDTSKRLRRPLNAAKGGKDYAMLPTHLMKLSRSKEDLSVPRR